MVALLARPSWVRLMAHPSTAPWESHLTVKRIRGRSFEGPRPGYLARGRSLERQGHRTRWWPSGDAAAVRPRGTFSGRRDAAVAEIGGFSGKPVEAEDQPLVAVSVEVSLWRRALVPPSGRPGGASRAREHPDEPGGSVTSTADRARPPSCWGGRRSRGGPRRSGWGVRPAARGASRTARLRSRRNVAWQPGPLTRLRPAVYPAGHVSRNLGDGEVA